MNNTIKDAETELETLRAEVEMYRTLVKNTAMHLKGWKELDSELSEFCSYADDIPDRYYTDADEGVHPIISLTDDLLPIEDEDEDNFDPDAIVLED